MHLGDKAYVYGYMTYLKRATAQILSLCKASDYGPLKALLISLYQKQIEEIRLYHNSLPVPDCPVEPISYEWNYFSERPLVNFNLAMKLLRKIYSSYGNQEFLPSYGALAKQYSMPLITVRCAVKYSAILELWRPYPEKGRGCW